MTTRITERIYLTNRQRKKLMPLIIGVEEGGAVIAQVYHDGIVCQVLSPEDALNVSNAMGNNPDCLLASSLAERYKNKGDNNG